MVKHLTAAILLHPWSNLSRSTRLFMRAVYEASNPALPKDMSKMRWLPVNAAAVLCCYLITRVTCLAQPIIPVRLFSRPWIWKLPLAEEPSYSKAHMLLSSREGRPNTLQEKRKNPILSLFLISIGNSIKPIHAQLHGNHQAHLNEAPSLYRQDIATAPHLNPASAISSTS
jgi:hypothetical protein